MEHLKHYSSIAVPADCLVKRRLPYSNPTAQPKTITVTTDCPFIRVKHPVLEVAAHSNAYIQLRMHFTRADPHPRAEVLVDDGEQAERLLFEFRVQK